MTNSKKYQNLEIDALSELISICEDHFEHNDKRVEFLSNQLQESFKQLNRFLPEDESSELANWIQVNERLYDTRQFDTLLISELATKSKENKILALFIEGKWREILISQERFNQVLTALSGNKILDLRKSWRKKEKNTNENSKYQGKVYQ